MPAKHNVIINKEGEKSYRFYCELSGIAVYSTEYSNGETAEKDLNNAWEKAHEHFNYCSKCGRYVSNIMFNVDLGECVDCSPWQLKPLYCTKCGTSILDNASFCPICSEPIKREGISTDD